MSAPYLVCCSNHANVACTDSHDFQQLAEVPPALAWFINMTNEQTRRAYQYDVQELTDFAGVAGPGWFY